MWKCRGPCAVCLAPCTCYAVRRFSGVRASRGGGVGLAVRQFHVPPPHLPSAGRSGAEVPSVLRAPSLNARHQPQPRPRICRGRPRSNPGVLGLLPLLEPGLPVPEPSAGRRFVCPSLEHRRDVASHASRRKAKNNQPDFPDRTDAWGARAPMERAGVLRGPCGATRAWPWRCCSAAASPSPPPFVGSRPVRRAGTVGWVCGRRGVRRRRAARG